MIKFCLTLLVLTLVFCQSNSTLTRHPTADIHFSTFGAKTFRENEPYHLTVFSNTNFNDSSSLPENEIPDFTFFIKCEGGVEQFKSDSLKLEIGTTQNATIQVGSLPGYVSACNLTIKPSLYNSNGQYSYGKSQPLILERGESSEINTANVILIQTDKPVYKPKDIVKFRILVLNKYLQIIPKSKITIEISDSQKNVIKRLKNIKIKDSLYSGNLTLSEEPNLGDWKLTVSSNEVTKSALFKIEKYTLPKFRVNLKHKSYVTNKETNLTVEIRAFYTYGKGINGNATIELRNPATLEMHSWLGFIVRKAKQIIKSVEIVNGIGTVDFDIKEFGVTALELPEIFKLTANVTEKATEATRSGDSIVTLHRNNLKLNLLTSPAYNPGLPFIIKFKIVTQDGTPIEDDRPDAVVVRGKSGNIPEYRLSIPNDGIITLEYESWTTVGGNFPDLNVKYKDFETKIIPLARPRYSKSVMKIHSSKQSVSPGETITLNIRTSMVMDKFLKINYFLKTEDILVNEGIFTLEEYTNAADIEIKINEFEFRADTLKLCVFFFEKNDEDKAELLFDSIDLTVDSSTKKSLQLQTSKDIYKPGENVSINVLGNLRTPSILALRAVDESVLLFHNKDNDITAKSLDENREILTAEINDATDVADYISKSDLAFLSYTFDVEVPQSEETNYVESDEFIVSEKMAEREEEDPRLDERIALAQIPAMQDRDMFLQVPNAIIPPPERAEITPTMIPIPLEPKIRKHFPETWIWQEIPVAASVNNSITTFETIMPETMTSWVITAFALNKDSGLRVMKTPHTLKTFQPFFASLNLPYSVIRGKAFALQVLVHNYLDKYIVANVTLDNSKNEYQFVDSRQEFVAKPSKLLGVPANQVASVNFVIVPTRFGNITLNVNAVSLLDSGEKFSDALSRPLLVLPDGVKKTVTKNVLIDLKDSEKVNDVHNIGVSFPTRRVRGADKIKINVAGDVMGLSTENLEELIRLPTGCGEQNMLKFVPDILILKYLTSQRTLTSQIKAKLLKYLEEGYMQQLKFLHPDGSFSAFGPEWAQIGSTWLTAFVVKSFVWAAEFITIDEQVIKNGLEFLIANQDQRTGEFLERGRVFDVGMQGGSGAKGVSVTAYVSLAVHLLSKSKFESLSSYNLTLAVEKGLGYISRQSTKNSKDPFSIVLSAYVLQSADHPSKDQFCEEMEKLSSTTSEGYVYWENANGKLKGGSVTPLSIEMTSYALLTYLSRNQFDKSVPVFKWLISQRNSHGGFKSTQDTVVGLMALSTYAEKIISPHGNNIKVDVAIKRFSKSFSVDENNLGVQEIILPGSNSGICKIRASGNGTAIVQVSSSYYVGGDDYNHTEVVSDDANQSLPFIITTKMKKLDEKGESVELTVSTKATYIERTAMALVEVRLPQTYVIYEEDLNDTKDAENVNLVEIETGKGSSKLNVYYDFLSNRESSFTVVLSRSHLIADIRTLTIVAYEYNGDKKSIMFDQLPYKTICDVCIESNACDVENCTS